MPTRVQLSLFVPPPLNAGIEAIRRVADPVQSRLIPAHVTLCREDELAGLDLPELRARLARARCTPVTLQFGPAEQFAGHGMLLPCVGGVAEFQALREVALAKTQARPHAPHLTLAHPRNPKAPGNNLASTDAFRAGMTITFDEILWIAQLDDSPWVVRGAAPLLG